MLINLRNALMAGKRLPYDAEVEYLESTGTQWIDTEVYGNLDSVAEITAQWTGTSGFAPLFGARNSYNSRGFAVYNGSDQGYLWCFSFDNVFSYDWARSNVLSNDSLTHNIRIGYNCRVDNWSAIWSSAGQFTTSNTLLVFAWNQNGTITAGSYRVYSCKIWDNGVLVRDYIPVRKGTVGYLYDRVSGKLFGNAGTGDFVLGADVVPVEWVRMNDGQYTLFDYTPSADTSCEVKIRPIILNPKNGSRGIFGSEIANNNKSFLVMFENDEWATNLLQFRFGTYLNQTDVTQFEVGNLYNIKLNGSGGFVDGIKVVNTTSANPSGSTQTKFGIGCYTRGGDIKATLGTYDYYGLTIEDGVFRANFRPVRVGSGSTWEGAMMDTLTRKIYRNQGSGAFTYGNDLKYPIPAE